MTNRALAKLYEVPISFKTNRPTTAKNEIEEIFWKLEQAGAPDRVLEIALEVRSLDTQLNNYIPNWQPRGDGKVHTTWGFTAPSGQLDSNSPNVLNLSKWTETGQRFRRIVEAPQGYSFVEVDKKSFHVATMGYCAEDRDYIRFSQLDPHTIFASYICPRDWCKPIELSMGDGDILERCNWLKAKCKEVRKKDPKRGVDLRQDIAKRVVLANQLGQGKRGLYRKELRRYVKDENEAGEYQDRLNDLFPKVKQFKFDIRDVANGFDMRHATPALMKLKARFGGPKFLILREWGIIDYFFDVYSWRYSQRDRQWKKAWGTDSEKAVAFPVQGEAFGMLKWEIRGMDHEGYLDCYNFVNSIHDSCVFLPRDVDVDNYIAEVGGYMAKPCSRLVNEATGPEGLRVGVEVSVGKNLQTFDYFGASTNPQGMREVPL